MARWSVTVKPGSRRGPLVVPEADGSLTVHVRERAVEGAANAGLIAALAAHFGVRRREITIVSGAASRRKIVDVED